MASTATQGAALAVIKRMFEDPIPNLHLPPFGTSMSQLLECQHATYSPEKWADPLLLFKWKLGESEDVAEVMPVTEITDYSPFELITYTKSQPDLSVFGHKLKAMWKSEMCQLYDEEEFEYIKSNPEWSMANLLNYAVLLPNLGDEAAIVRLLLLQIMLSKPTELMQASSLVHQIAVNMSVKEDTCIGSWSPPRENETKTATSALYVLTIDEYNGINYHNTVLKDQSLNDVPPSDVVYIPVSCRYSGRSWLMAYILSFTSTSWWNHAYTLDVEYTNAVEEATAGLPMKATFMPKAATVCILGNYSYICLVVVDATRAKFPDDWQFEVCKGITATRAGNFDFAKNAYAYLGRLSDPDVTPICCDDLYFALQEMTYMFSGTAFRQLQLKASILATSRFNGFGCYPNPEPPENRKHIFGPAAFNNKNEIQIGDYVVPDLAKMEEEERRTRLHVFNLWRCDPLGFFTALQNDVSMYFRRYRLSVSTNNMRVLRACGVFRAPERGFQGWGPSDMLSRSLGYGSLILGLTNWALVEMGCTMFDHNRVSYPNVDRNFYKFNDTWEKITSGFVTKLSWGNMPAITIDANLRKVGWIMNISEQEDSVKASWIHTHYSGNVPWWFVGAIAAKFGHSFKIETPGNCLFENEIGWCIKESSGQYDLFIFFHTYSELGQTDLDT